jgi:hypothetical protein
MSFRCTSCFKDFLLSSNKAMKIHRFCDCVVLVFLFLPLLVTLEFLTFYFPARHRVFSVLWIIDLGRSETLLNATGVGGRNTVYFAFCTCH